MILILPSIQLQPFRGCAYQHMTNFLWEIFFREIQIRMGQCPVKKYNEQLLHLIEVGRINPLPLISHTMSLDEAPKAYESFDSQKNDVTKVVLKTGL
jgi:S-(hydroxymethyl)glutathione dehydrogenase / alcohol dehydrogenase